MEDVLMLLSFGVGLALMLSATIPMKSKRPCKCKPRVQKLIKEGKMLAKPNPYDVKTDKKLEELLAFNKQIQLAIKRSKQKGDRDDRPRI